MHGAVFFDVEFDGNMRTVNRRLLDRTPIVLIGGGRHASVILEAARLRERSVAGFVDDKPGNRCMPDDASYLGCLQHLSDCAHQFLAILAIGQLSLRRDIIETYDGPFASVVHPQSILSRHSHIEHGTFVAAGAIVGGHAVIGKHAIVNTRALVEHDCVLESNVHLAPGAVLGGGVRIGSDSMVGLNASVKSHVSIGRGCVVGAGAVVVRDVEDGTVVVGVPARPIQRSLHCRQSA